MIFKSKIWQINIHFLSIYSTKFTATRIQACKWILMVLIIKLELQAPQRQSSDMSKINFLYSVLLAGKLVI